MDKGSQRGIGGQDLQSLNSEGDELVKKNRTIFSSTKKIRLQSEINRLNDEVNGGIVFITGAVQVGTGISVRRMRYNVLKPATGMAYYFSQNGVQSSDCETMLNDSRKYLLKLPN